MASGNPALRKLRIRSYSDAGLGRIENEALLGFAEPSYSPRDSGALAKVQPQALHKYINPSRVVLADFLRVNTSFTMVDPELPERRH